MAHHATPQPPEAGTGTRTSPTLVFLLPCCFAERRPTFASRALFVSRALQATLEAEELLPKLLQSERLGQQWEQLLTSVHDAPASRGNPWWQNVSLELGPTSVGGTKVDDEGKPL